VRSRFYEVGFKILSPAEAQSFYWCCGFCCSALVDAWFLNDEKDATTIGNKIPSAF